MPSNPSQIGANKWIDRKHGLTKPTDMTEGGGHHLAHHWGHDDGNDGFWWGLFLETADGSTFEAHKFGVNELVHPSDMAKLIWMSSHLELGIILSHQNGYIMLQISRSIHNTKASKKNNTLKVTHPPVSLLFSRTTRNRAWNPLPRPTSMICADPVGTAGRQAKLQEQRRSVQPRCLPEGQDMFLMLKRSEGMDGFMIHFITVNDIIPATPTHSFPACFTHQ